METKAEWLTDKYIIVMLAAFPLWTGFRGYGDITRAKFTAFAGLTLAWLIGLAVCAFMERRPLGRLAPEGFAAVALMGAAALSALLSPYGEGVFFGSSRWDGLFTFLLYGFIFLGVSRYARARRRYIRALALSCTLCCVVAVFQLYRVNVLGLFPTGYDYYGANVYYTGAFLGTIGNVDVLAAYLALCIPAFAGYMLLSREKRALWLFIPLALGLYVSYRSGVASGYIALLAAALIGGPYLVWRRFGRRGGIAAASLSLFCVAAGLAVCYFWPGNSGSVWEASQILHGNIDDSFGSHRVEIWRECLRLFRERPLFGGGPDTLGLRTGLGYSRFVEESGLTISVHIDNAHNEFLGYLVNLGIAGLTGYIALVALTLLRALKSSGAVAAALSCGLVGYLAQSLFGLGLCLVVPLVFIFMGLICAGEGC